MSLLPKTLRISYMISVYMEWSPKQHPRMYYFLNTCHRRCNRDMIILVLLTTETSHMYGTAAWSWWWKQNVGQMLLTKYQTIQRIHSLLFFCDQVGYFVDTCMTISKFDLGNSWPRSQARSVAKVIYEINQPIYSHCFCFVQIGPYILKK